ncbi:MAG: tyrosine-type recombinase/integrase [Actinomycetota bacterium]|nr:tyrosine-type recombinase/integrase [Actinomycetota bacterium]
MGLAAASRRRNLSEFDVADATMTSEGLLLEFRRTKTEPRTVDLREVGGRYCPVVNLREWLACYEELAGRPLLGRDPLFPRLDRHGNLQLDADGAHARLSRAAFSDIVRRRAEQAGLVGRYRSHSLRRRFATTLARKKVPLEKIARRGGWKSLDVVWGYIEEAGWFEEDWSCALGLQELDAG